MSLCCYFRYLFPFLAGQGLSLISLPALKASGLRRRYDDCSVCESIMTIQHNSLSPLSPGYKRVILTDKLRCLRQCLSTLRDFLSR